MIDRIKKFDLTNKSIFIAGHNGMVGKATLNELKLKSNKIYTIDKKKLDLRDE